MNGRERRDQGGFVLVTSALFLFVLMAMAAFVVDLGLFYSQAGRIQRAADAAALAGVVRMPNLVDAQAVALETAARNGFVDDNPALEPGKEIDVHIRDVPGSAQRLRVQIYDRRVEVHFARLFSGDISITRLATGHYAEPLPLGSPENLFGSGQIDLPTFGGGTFQRQNYYAAINGRCSAGEEGDLLSSGWDGNANVSGSYICPGTEAFPTYDPDGYTFVVELASPPSQAVQVMLYDPWFVPSPTYDDNQFGTNSSFDYPFGGKSDTETDLDTTFRAFCPDSSDSPYIYEDDRPIDLPSGSPSGPERTFTSKGGPGAAFVPLFTIGSDGCSAPSSYPARYRINVRSDANRNNSWGTNIFSVGAIPVNEFRAGRYRCTSLANPNCPRVYALDQMSIWANSRSSNAELWLAQIDDVHAGKEVMVELWDPGEGGNFIEILAPTGPGTWQPSQFTWDASNGTSGSSGTVNPRLDVSGTAVDPRPGRFGTGTFNDHLVRIRIRIPQDYTDANNQGWWRIRYRSRDAGPVEDRTTWRIYVEGDPVHLVDE